MSFLATHLVGFGVMGSTAAPASITFAAAAGSTTGSPYTFSSHSIGTASSDRYVVVCVSANDTATISSLTVAGQSCTQVVRVTSGSQQSAIFITDAPVTSGTTGDVVVTYSGSSSNKCGIGTFAVTGLLSNTATATATQTTNNTATSLSVTGDGVAVCCGFTAGVTTSSTMTNATERYDASFGGIPQSSHTGGSDNQATTTSISITINFASPGSDFSGAYAAFR